MNGLPTMLFRTAPIRVVLGLATLLVVSVPGANASAVESVEAQPQSIIVVCPSVFREALVPWIQQRENEGLQIRLIESQATAERLLESLRQQSQPSDRYVLLVGDAPAVGKWCDADRQVPTFYARMAITEKWGSTPTGASDLGYGDLRDDSQVDAAVGRFPVKTPEQLSQLVQRILAYEQSNDFGPWRGQVQLTGGVGGFGAFIDATIETVTRTLVTTMLPTETKTTVAYASPGHLFYPTERSFTDEVLTRYQRGARFWVYAGHGWIDSLDRVPQTPEGVAVLDNESVQRLQITPGVAPIALLLACYTGAIDAPQDSLAERMLLAPSGPVSVFAGSRMTMPYGNTVTAVGLIDGVYRKKLDRLGDAWLDTLGTLHREDETEKSQTRMLIDSLAALVSPTGTSLSGERREHATLYNLLGDPTLRLHHPHGMELKTPSGFAPDEPIVIDLQSPIDGELVLSVDRPLGAETGGDPNEVTVASLQTQVRAQEVTEHRITIPAGITGPLVIRALVRGTETWATAATRTLVR